LKKALVGHKKTKLILNKLDIMQDLEEVKVCDYYLDENNQKIEVIDLFSGVGGYTQSV
jgi:adenylosuccinate synthase